MPKALVVKICSVCDVNSSLETERIFYNKTLCRRCFDDKRRVECGHSEPVIRRTRCLKPSVCKFCKAVPSETLKFKSRFQCFPCYYVRHPVKKMYSYDEATQAAKREYGRLYSREYYKKLKEVYSKYQNGDFVIISRDVQPSNEHLSKSETPS